MISDQCKNTFPGAHHFHLPPVKVPPPGAAGETVAFGLFLSSDLPSRLFLAATTDISTPVYPRAKVALLENSVMWKEKGFYNWEEKREKGNLRNVTSKPTGCMQIVYFESLNSVFNGWWYLWFFNLQWGALTVWDSRTMCIYCVTLLCYHLQSNQ